MYIPPFSRLKSCIRNEAAMPLIVDMIKITLRSAISAGYLDEAWYLKTYSDIAQAVAKGEVPSAAVHFREHGYFEDRRPRAFVVDEDWYRRKYPDVAADVRRRVIQSCSVHYSDTGYAEGRIPTPQEEEEVVAWNHLIDRYSGN
jgi:hypothetical protein